MRTQRLLEGTVALVTGSGRGIGRGAAIMLARHGAKVGLVALGSAELAETKRLVEAEGAEALALEADVSDRAAVDRAVSAIEQAWGPVKLLVNNAAILPLYSFAETTPEIWDQCLAVNLTGYYNVARRVYPGMREARDGAMIHVSSAAGIKGFVNETAYCATKFGIEGMAKSMAMELSEEGILVTLVRPGIRTKLTNITMEEYAALPAEKKQEWADPIVMGEAFVALGRSREMALAGQRFNLWQVSEAIRELGWESPLQALCE